MREDTILPLVKYNKAPRLVHSLSSAVGGMTSEYFSGFAASVGYQLSVKKNIIRAGYRYLEEFIIFGNNPDHASELYLLYCYPLIQKKIAISVGAGISSVHNRIALYKIFEREYGPGYYTQTGYSYQERLSKTCFGFPVELQIASNKEKLNGGLNVHGNINNINRFISFSGYVSYAF